MIIFRASHRGFGARAKYHYHKKNGAISNVQNTLTGFELGVINGANTLEIDLCKTRDGYIVTTHGIPLMYKQPLTKDQYLKSNPEILLLEELLEWLCYQDNRISLYLELKSQITITEIYNIAAQTISKVQSSGTISIDFLSFCKRIMVYTHNLDFCKTWLKEKQILKLKTDQIKLWWLSVGLISSEQIISISHLGNIDNRLFGVEQGVFPYLNEVFFKIINLKFCKYIPFLAKFKTFYEFQLKTQVSIAHSNNLKFLIGTLDNLSWLAKLKADGVDGFVPNNPLVYKKLYYKAQDKIFLVQYIPESVRFRLSEWVIKCIYSTF